MALTYTFDFLTRSGQFVLLIKDREEVLGWVCRGCLAGPTPAEAATPLASAKAHADTCTAD
jgi:hypothetical protein